MGAKATGCPLAAHTNPRLSLLLADRSPSYIADIRDFNKMSEVLQAADPQIVIHMAAQALVRESYRDPLGTYSTNVMGTANLLQSCRALKHLQAVVIVTSDKVYENHGEGRAFVEEDRLG